MSHVIPRLSPAHHAAVHTYFLYVMHTSVEKTGAELPSMPSATGQKIYSDTRH